MPSAGIHSPTQAQRGESWVLPALLLAACVVTAYVRPLWTRENFVGQDIPSYILPLEKTVHDALARGHLPVWSEEISGGRPLFPNPNSGSLYPARPLLAALPFPMAMRVFPVLHWIAAGWGMLLFFRSLRRSRAAAWVAAATYTFSGVSVSEVYYCSFQPGATLLPWVLWAIARPAAPARKAVPLALSFGLLLLAGDAVSVAIALAAAILWIVLEGERWRRKADFGALGLGLMMALLLAAPQVIATALVTPQTRRAVTGIRLAEALGFSVSPWRWLELIVPYPFGATWALDDGMNWGHAVFRCYFATFFCGALPLIGLLGKTASREAGRMFARVLFGGAIVLAAAGGLVPDAWLQWPAPLPLRYPEKLMLGATLAMAVAAGIAFDRLRATGRQPAGVFGVAVGLALAAVAAWLFPAIAGTAAAAAVGAPAEAARQAGEELPGALAAGGLLWAATLLTAECLRTPGRGRVIGAAAVFSAIPFAATRCIAQTASEQAILTPTVFARAIARRDPAGAYRTIDASLYRPATPMLTRSLQADPYHLELQRQAWYCHTPALWGRGVVFNADLDRGDLSRVETLRRLSGGAANRPEGAAFFASLGLRFAIRFRDQAPLPGFEPFGGDSFRSWDENPSALPVIRLLERWREEPSATAAMARIPQLTTGEVVLETGRVASGVARPGSVRISQNSPERLSLEVDAAEATWLFVVRDYWDSRSVRVDGREVVCVPAQLAFSAVPVPAGRHHVEWCEEIPGIRVTMTGPALFALLCALFLIPRRLRAGEAHASEA